jgi:hypothetical protein
MRFKAAPGAFGLFVGDMFVADGLMIGDLFFVLSKLHFELMDHAIERRDQFLGRRMSNEFFGVFRFDSDFEPYLLRLFQIDRDHYR